MKEKVILFANGLHKMKIYINDESFSYDVHSLVKAFFQDDDVIIEKIPADDSDFVFKMEDIEVSLNAENEERSLFKNRIKREIYSALSNYTGKKLPWGTLTGIRPTKIPMGLINDGVSDDDVAKYMKDTYYVSDEKTRLSIDIAKREQAIINRLSGTNGFSLYIGIPFCPTTCMYCSFTSYPIIKWKKRVDEYIAAVKKEIDYVRDNLSDKVIDTVYIGGGTPTTLEPEQFDDLIGYLRSNLDLSKCQEFTVEAGRPDSITEEKLIALKRNGVTRISVNPQTMNEETLRLIGRNHTVKQFREVFALAKKYFDNINTDLILGLPGESEKQVSYTFKEIEKLAPESITVHSMAIKRAAHMDEYLKNHPEIKSINSPEMMDMAAKCADNLGMSAYYLYRQKNMSGNYENTGYSLPGKEGIYNILIMEEIQTIVALGAGTVTKRVYGNGRIERCDNVKDVDLYINKIDEMIDRKRKLFE